MKRRDIWIIGAVAVLAGLLLLLGQVIKPAPPVKALPTLSITNAREPGSGGPLEEANSYLRIRQGQEYYHLVPLNGPGRSTASPSTICATSMTWPPRSSRCSP